MDELAKMLVPVGAISEATKAEMYRLLERHYEGTSYEKFIADLSEKEHVFMFREGPRLVGFSTIVRQRIPELANAIFVFSGDTVIDEEYWGGRFLQIAFGYYMFGTKLFNPRVPVYWMLISKGVKTYLMMRRNFQLSHPNYSGETPRSIKHVMDGFYTLKFGQVYDPETGLIRFAGSGDAARGESADPPEKLKSDPDVMYYLNLNPDYKQGVELACLAEIRFADYGPIVRKYILGKG